MKPQARPILILGLLLFFPSILWAQKSGPEDTLFLPKKPLSIQQIATFNQKTNRLMQETEALLAIQSENSLISPSLTEADKVITQKLLLFGDTTKIYRIDRLRSEKEELTLLQEKLSKWQQEQAALLDNALDKDTLIEQYIIVWELTLDSLIQAKITPPDTLVSEEDSLGQTTDVLIAEKDTIRTQDTLREVQEGTEATQESIALMVSNIQDYLRDLTQVKKELTPVLDQLQFQQANLAVVLSRLNEAQSRIEVKRQEALDEIFIPEYPPIWAMSWDSDPKEINSFLYDYFESDFLVLERFLENRPRFVYFSVFFFLIIFALVIQLRFRAHSMSGDFEKEIKEARVALRYPVLASLMITWFGLDLIFDLPAEVDKLFAAFTLLPLSFMLWKLRPEWGYARVLVFIGMYTAFLLIPALNNLVAIQRVTLLTIDLINLGLLLWLRTQKQRIAQENPWFLGSLSLLIPVFIFIWAVAILANILGSVQLSLFLTVALLGTNLIFNVLRLMIELIRSLLFLILLGPVHKHSYILQEDAAAVLKKITHILKWLSLFIWMIFTLDLLTIRNRFFDAIHEFISYEIKIGDVGLSLRNFLAFYIILQVSLWLSSILRYLLDKEVYPRAQLKEGVPDTISLTIRYTLVFLGFTLALTGAGIQFSQLSLALGGLGVGIGFGLQNIVSNFISGIILVLERPMKIGDYVELQEISGVVRDIGLRASTVRTWQGSDVVVPNSEFISQRLTNWTFQDKHRRLNIEVRVPFDSNMEELMKMLLDTAHEIPEVLKRPSPALHFSGIGESAMQVTLFCWIPDAMDTVKSGTIIRAKVYQALRDAGYEIPLPKQDIHLKRASKD